MKTNCSKNVGTIQKFTILPGNKFHEQKVHFIEWILLNNSELNLFIVNYKILKGNNSIS